MAIGGAGGSKSTSGSADAAINHNDTLKRRDAVKYRHKAATISVSPAKHQDEVESTTAGNRAVPAKGKKGVPDNDHNVRHDFAPIRKTDSGAAAARMSANASRVKPGHAGVVSDRNISKIRILADSISRNPTDQKIAALTYRVEEIGLATKHDPYLQTAADPKYAMKSDKAIMDRATGSNPIARSFVERAIRANQHDRVITSLAQLNQPQEHTQEYYRSLEWHIDDAVDWMIGSHPEDRRIVEYVRTPKLDRFRDILSQFSEKQGVDEYPPLSPEIFTKLAIKFAQNTHIIDNNKQVLNRTAFDLFMLIVSTYGTAEQYQTFAEQYQNLIWTFNEDWSEKPDKEKFRTAPTISPHPGLTVAAAKQDGTASKAPAKLKTAHVAARRVARPQTAAISDKVPTLISDNALTILSDATAMINEIRRTRGQSLNHKELGTRLKNIANAYFRKMTGELSRDQNLSSVPDPRIAKVLDKIIMQGGDAYPEIKHAIRALVGQNQRERIITGLTALNQFGEISLAPQIDDAVDWMVSQHPGDGSALRDIRKAQLGRLEEVLSSFSGDVSPLSKNIFLELVLKFAKNAQIIDENMKVLPGEETAFSRFAEIIRTYGTENQYLTLMNAFNKAWIEQMTSKPRQDTTPTTPPLVSSRD